MGAAMKLDPMFARDRTAAALIDMKPAEFNKLVAAGYLPKPRLIGTVERFDMDELRRIIRGDAIGGGAMEW
jgi:hypothetical protein